MRKNIHHAHFSQCNFCIHTYTVKLEDFLFGEDTCGFSLRELQYADIFTRRCLIPETFCYRRRSVTETFFTETFCMETFCRGDILF
jgi:hypothetical protein